MADLAALDAPTLRTLLERGGLGAVAQERIRALLSEREHPPAPTPAPELRLREAEAEAAEPTRPKRPGKRRGVPNLTEARYAREVLEPLLGQGVIVAYEYEALTFHVHGVSRYTPDFVARLPDGRLWCHEVKGPQAWKADLKTWKEHSAARPWLRWTFAQWKDQRWTVLHERGEGSAGSRAA